MPLWGNHNNANNAPKFTVQANTGGKGTQLYGTVVQAVNAVSAEANTNYGLSTPGWTYKKVGTGPVASLNIGAGGTLYSNSDTITVSGGTTNATANIVTDGNGVITSLTNLVGGAGFTNSATVAITTSTGSGATITATLGGRANRVQYEILVALNDVLP